MPKIKDGSVSWAFTITLAGCMTLMAVLSLAGALFGRATSGDFVGGLAFAAAALVLFKVAARIRASHAARN